MDIIPTGSLKTASIGKRIEPDDPWSYIGYWGDHQVIYLLKFLEFAEKVYPGMLHKYFSEDLFVYANVPYKLKATAKYCEIPRIRSILIEIWTMLSMKTGLNWVLTVPCCATVM
jgi:hypothetical protein